MTQDILLITSAIQSPPSYQTITDATERLTQTLCSLIRWIRDTSIETIVFCDGTMPTYNFSRVQAFAKEHGTTLEILLFQESKKYLTHGKGYAEGEVLEYAMTHSEHLKDGVRFYKVTGRTFIENFNEIRERHAQESIVFASPAALLMPTAMHISIYKALTYPPLCVLRHALHLIHIAITNLFKRHILSLAAYDTVWTQFYKCDVSIFKKRLMASYHRINDWDNSIEREFFHSLENTPFAQFAIRPTIIGRSGGYGFAYDDDYTPEDRRLAETFL